MPKLKDKTKEKKTKASESKQEDAQLFSGLSKEGEEKLIEQIKSEYTLAWWYAKPRIDEWALRIKLYNNQRRDKEAVGDPLIFTIHQTVLAAMYNDRLSVSFSAREMGDEEKAENLDNLAEYDYEEMQKDIIDYIWDWDALFFGCGLLLMQEFDIDMNVPVPENIDRMTFLWDPRAKSLNGDMRGRGRARFCGRELRMTKYDMQENENYKNINLLKPDDRDLRSLVDEAERVRSDAQGYTQMQQFKELTGTNKDYRLLEWWTFFAENENEKPKLVYVTLGNNKNLITRYKVLNDKEFPIEERRLFPVANEFNGVSIPDLVEDKQRARSVIQNVAVKSVRSSVHPRYVYDATKITNKNDLNVEFDKYIGVYGNPNGAIQIVPKDTVKQDVDFILNMLDASSQRATATPDIMQGQITKRERTLGELELVEKGVTGRQSLSIKIFGWSEKRFWRRWYKLYKQFFKEDISEKVIRITGVLGAQWRTFSRDEIIMNTDPDIKIVSKAISDAERFNMSQLFSAFMSFTQNDPNANVRGMEKEMGRLIGLKKDKIDLFLPPTIEEMRARDENIILETGGKVMVLPTDDHRVHIEEHNKMPDNAYKFAHINAHKRALLLQRTRPDLFGMLPSSDQNPTASLVDNADQPEIGKPAQDGKSANRTGKTAGVGQDLPTNTGTGNQ